MTRHEQRVCALEKSWRLKEDRRRLRLALAHRKLTLLKALAHPCAERLAIATLLPWQPWWGPVRSRKALNTLSRAGIPPTVRAGELTGKPRLLVAMVCMSHEPRRLQAVSV